MERWWAENVRTVEIALETDAERGLTEEEAKKRLERYGENKIEREKKVSPLVIFARQFQDPLVYILLVAAGISAFLGEFTDFLLISIILVFNAIFGFVQEYRAEKAIEALKKMTTPRAKVLRDGKLVEIPATEVVPGDVVILEEGDAVPADIRLVEAKGLTIDESLLTGESIPVIKTVEALPEETALADRKNMAYMGTFVVKGHGMGIVVATGMNTEMGRIAHEIAVSEEKKTHLEEELERLGSFLTKAILGIVAVTGGIMLAYNPTIQGAANALLTSVSLAVAAVPEGLPAVVTITLALGVRQMAKRKAIVRRLKSVETLGSVDVICTDKTGTLTYNKMRVVEKYGDEEKMAEIGYFCHSLDENGNGDPTEVAIFEWAKERGPFEGKKVDEIPFDSERKRMTVIVERDGKQYAYMKGAPEIVLSLCSLKADERKKLAEKAEALASKGLRVLALAWKEYDGIDPEGNMHFAGFVGLLDPPREDAIRAMKTAMEAGIRVIMITGDHAKTAEAIARTMGLKGRTITGAELDRMSDEELDEIIEEVAVFARVSPHHKPRIVEALQKRGHIVAMTGDGVNDAVALKRADIGVAMGSGTEVAKEAADMILIDDSFATIVAAIEEGRRIFNNIKSFVIYLLSANMGEVVAVFSGSLFGYAVLKPAQLLWMNLLTDGPPALAISADPAPEDIMKRPPRKRGEGLLTERDKRVRILLFGAILGLGILGMFLVNAHDIALAQGAVLTGFVVLELVRLDIIREVPLWKNKYLVATVLGVLVLQLLVLYTPLSSILGVKALTLEDWGEIAAFAVIIYFLAKVMKV
ncbi:MAG: P-type Ca2+ transporter type [Candidatus Diapherotrites archaeon]|nr:P-type Ca2+ transporter type [Candidatus Diapherotrites archaeon]MDN5367094.1 P-type Ca2+ transporter type [Candidatus Diapherotrites archaeon]